MKGRVDEESQAVRVHRANTGGTSSPLGEIKERSAGANPFRSRENVSVQGNTSLPRRNRPRKPRGRERRIINAARARRGLQPLCRVYTARYLSGVCLKKCAPTEMRIQAAALGRRSPLSSDGGFEVLQSRTLSSSFGIHLTP